MDKAAGEYSVISQCAIRLLRMVGTYELHLHGDPSGPLPLFLLSSRPWLRENLPGVKPVEPRAQYCKELLRQGLIEPRTVAAEFGDQFFQESEKGRALLLDLDRREGFKEVI